MCNLTTINNVNDTIWDRRDQSDNCHFLLIE